MSEKTKKAKDAFIRGCYCNIPNCGIWIERGDEVYVKKYGRICLKCALKSKGLKPLEKSYE